MTTPNAPAAPASTPNTTPTVDAAKPTASKSQQLAERLNAMSAKPPVATEAPASDPPSTERPAPSSRDATKLSQALHKATTAERQALEHKSAREKAEARLKELEAQVSEFTAARGDLNKLLQYGKVTPEQLAEKFLKRELNFTPTPDTPPAPELSEEVKREIEYARTKREQEEAETARKLAEDNRAADLKTIGEQMATLADKFPLVSALPGASERLLDAMLLQAEGNNGDLPEDFNFEAMVKGAEDSVAAELKAVAGSDAALKVLVADEGVATKLRALLGVAPARAKVNPPALNARNTSEVPTTKKGWDASAAAARLRAMGS